MKTWMEGDICILYVNILLLYIYIYIYATPPPPPNQGLSHLTDCQTRVQDAVLLNQGPEKACVTLTGMAF